MALASGDLAPEENPQTSARPMGSEGTNPLPGERVRFFITAPGCSSYSNLQDHHVVYLSLGGGDELENRTTLCAWHHLRGVHGGIVRCTGRAPAGLRFELGLRRGAPPLVAYRGEVVAMDA